MYSDCLFPYDYLNWWHLADVQECRAITGPSLDTCGMVFLPRWNSWTTSACLSRLELAQVSFLTHRRNRIYDYFIPKNGRCFSTSTTIMPAIGIRGYLRLIRRTCVTLLPYSSDQNHLFRVRNFNIFHGEIYNLLSIKLHSHFSILLVSSGCGVVHVPRFRSKDYSLPWSVKSGTDLLPSHLRCSRKRDRWDANYSINVRTSGRVAVIRESRYATLYDG